MPSQSITLPPFAVLDAAAHELATAARAAGDLSRERAISKAQVQLLSGAAPIAVFGALLIESRTNAGAVHRVSHTSGCSCAAAQAGRACWHAALVEIVIDAQARALPALGQRIADAHRKTRAEIEMDECFT